MARGPGGGEPALDRGAVLAARRGAAARLRGRAVRAHRARYGRRARGAPVLLRQPAVGPGARVLRHRGARGAAVAAARAPARRATALFVAPNPAGFLVLSELPDAETLWLISTGTGIAPFLSILRTEAPWKRYRNVVLVHAVRHARELVYRDLICGLKNLKYVSFVSRETAPGSLAGRIPAAIGDGRLEAAAGVRLEPRPRRSCSAATRRCSRTPPRR